MKQEFYNLEIQTKGQRLYEFTNNTLNWIKKNNFQNGIINLSIQHTSASLIIQENADPDVQRDLISHFDKVKKRISATTRQRKKTENHQPRRAFST